MQRAEAATANQGIVASLAIFETLIDTSLLDFQKFTYEKFTQEEFRKAFSTFLVTQQHTLLRTHSANIFTITDSRTQYHRPHNPLLQKLSNHSQEPIYIKHGYLCPRLGYNRHHHLHRRRELWQAQQQVRFSGCFVNYTGMCTWSELPMRILTLYSSSATPLSTTSCQLSTTPSTPCFASLSTTTAAELSYSSSLFWSGSFGISL